MPKVDVHQLSQWLAKVQKAQAELFPGTELLIGGGSARDVLDHVLFERPLVTRDIDVFIVNGSRVDPERARAFYDRLAAAGLGSLKTTALRAKKRCNPALPAPMRYRYVVGYGAHFFRKDYPILSLGLLHTSYDLHLNGLLNIDKIYLRLSRGETFEGFCLRLLASRVSYRNLPEAGFIQDNSDGYRAWVESQPRMINWEEAERSPARLAIRITRSFAKAGCAELPWEVKTRFQKLLEHSAKIDDETEFKRGFVKVFSDRHWAQELGTLARLGVLQHISPELEDVALGLKSTAAKGEGWRDRWESVLAALSSAERERLRTEMEPALATSFA